MSHGELRNGTACSPPRAARPPVQDLRHYDPFLDRMNFLIEGVAGKLG